MTNAETQTIEMPEFVPNQPISQPTPKLLDEEKRRGWLDKWIGLRAYNPQLQSLEIALWSFCKDYAKRPSEGRRLLLYGSNGCGKSHCAKAVFRWANRLAINLPLQIGDDGVRLCKAEFCHWPRAVKRMHSGEWGLGQELARVDMLVLDDIGAEHDPSGFGKSELYLLLEARERRWTMLTTNYGPEEWESKFEKRIASRFHRNFEVVDLSQVADFITLGNHGKF
jgi:DNA replication protein DnaC